MSSKKQSIELFKQKAELVSAVVGSISEPKQALEYVVDLCERKEACQLLLSGCAENLSQSGDALCATKQQKVIAAPGLEKKQYKELEKLCAAKDFKLIASGMREHLGGVDIGFTYADHAIAETGSLVLYSRSEETRLATMLCEIHVAVLPVSKIKDTAFDLEKIMLDQMKSGPDYLAFITGPSRTADIERVLALGVHGPLELHILLWEDK